jgi:hypothetical protein
MVDGPASAIAVDVDVDFSSPVSFFSFFAMKFNVVFYDFFPPNVTAL